MKLLSRFGSGKSTDMSFVPEDYLARKAERRTNVVYLILFSVAMFGIVGAFFVTNRQWSEVKQYQEAINVRFSQAAKDIEQVKTLEDQKARLLDRAELTTALIEKVPRSVLLAELINRMPAEMTLLEFELEAEAIKKSSRPASSSKKPKSVSSKTKSRKAKGLKLDDDRPIAPKFEIDVTLIGVTPTHAEVAEYVSALKDSPLLRDVSLRFSEFIIMEDQGMNKFRIDAEIHADVDARKIEPMAQRRRGAFGGDDEDVASDDSDDESTDTTADAAEEGDWP